MPIVTDIVIIFVVGNHFVLFPFLSVGDSVVRCTVCKHMYIGYRFNYMRSTSVLTILRVTQCAVYTLPKCLDQNKSYSQVCETVKGYNNVSEIVNSRIDVNSTF